MALLTAQILSEDEVFRKATADLLRSGAVPVTITDGVSTAPGLQADLIVVDGRNPHDNALAVIDRWRIAAPSTSIFMVALESNPDLILQSMRAGANEFFAWPPSETAFHEAINRANARRNASSVARPRATTVVFVGAKGGSGTTTVAVNCAVELARLSKRSTMIVDLKAGLGEVTLFLGVRSRYSLLDAIDNLHRLDSEFLKELVIKHKSGLEILAGSDHFDRPAASDAGAIEQVLRLLVQLYEYIVVDAGSQLNLTATTALYMADTIYLVANPDVPSVRNAQRLLDRMGQLGACGERARVLLNRAAEPYPIPPAQIESALGRSIDHTFPSDYRTVSTALNSGVPLALTGNTDIAAQFDGFTRRILSLDVDPGSTDRRSTLGLQRLASMW
ncbi:MAG: AAA family ATPase [Vicinamibacterales bacterium]